jgi:hypothetical protein
LKIKHGLKSNFDSVGKRKIRSKSEIMTVL